MGNHGDTESAEEEKELTADGAENADGERRNGGRGKREVSGAA